MSPTWAHVAHLLRLGRPLCSPDAAAPVQGMLTLYPSKTTCPACCDDPAFQGELASEHMADALDDDEDDDGTGELWRTCGAANCGARTEWVDEAGIGWCSEHRDCGLYPPPCAWPACGHAEARHAPAPMGTWGACEACACPAYTPSALGTDQDRLAAAVWSTGSIGVTVPIGTPCEPLTLEALDAAIAMGLRDAPAPLIARALVRTLRLVHDADEKCERPRCQHTRAEHVPSTPEAVHLRCTVDDCLCAAGRGPDGLWERT